MRRPFFLTQNSKNITYKLQFQQSPRCNGSLKRELPQKQAKVDQQSYNLVHLPFPKKLCHFLSIYIQTVQIPLFPALSLPPLLQYKQTPSCLASDHPSVLQTYMSIIIGRTDSSVQPFRFFRIKDLHFFRHLLRSYDLSLLKDYLATSLTTLPIDPHSPHCLRPDHLYVPAEDARIRVQTAEGVEAMLVRAGHVFPDSVGEFWAQEGEGFTLYAIARRTVLILERLYFLDLPLMAGMKSSEKFSFLERCEVVTLSFNSFAYRRGEEVDAVYYLLEGQVKMFKELGENVYEVASLERGRLFGLFEVKNRIRHRELYARAGLNATAVMKIPIKLVEKVCLDRETTLDAMLADAKSEIYSMLPKNALSERRPSIPQRVESGTVSGNGSGSSGNGDSSRVMLQRRLKTFQSSRMIKSSVLEGLVYSKKMLYRVRELNERMQNCNARPGKLESQNPHAVRHFNDKWRKGEKERPQRTEKGKEKGKEEGAARVPFKRLLKYPSVQRYLGMDSSSLDPKLAIDLENP